MSILIILTAFFIAASFFLGIEAVEEKSHKLGTAAWGFGVVAVASSFLASSFYFAGESCLVNSDQVYVNANYNLLGTGKINEKEWWVTVEKDGHVYCWRTDKQPPANGQIVTKKDTNGEIGLVPYAMAQRVSTPAAETAEVKPNP